LTTAAIKWNGLPAILDVIRFASISLGSWQSLPRPLDVIVALGQEAALSAAKRASRTIPIVMVAVDYDPLALGYIQGRGADRAMPFGDALDLPIDFALVATAAGTLTIAWFAFLVWLVLKACSLL
jgi:hypothetical protein